MSILPALIDVQLLPDADVVWVDSTAIISVRQIEKRLIASRPPTAFDTSQYVGWGVRTRDNAESQIRSVVYKKADGTRKTIGCIFPVSSLDPSSDYSAENLENSHERAFASQAASLLVDRGIANDFVRKLFIDLDDESKLSDLFDPEMSVVVIGRPLMEQAGANEPLVKLMLQEFGYFVPPPKEQDDFRQFVSTDVGHRNIADVSPQSYPFIPELMRLVAVAARATSPVAAFMSYYQAIELFSQERFKSEVMRITQDQALLKDAWALREKLTEAAGEKKRLGALVACCNASDSAVVNSMHAIGKQILRSVGLEVDAIEKMSASEVLYKVRNVVVHDQKALPTSSYGDFSEFVYVTHQLVFSLMRAFDASIGHSTTPSYSSVGSAAVAQVSEAGSAGSVVSSGLREVIHAIGRRLASGLRAAIKRIQSPGNS